MGLRVLDIDLFCNSVRARLREDRDKHLCISGEEGDGKSTAAWHFAYRVDKGFDIEKQTVFSIDEFEEKACGLEKYKALILDEGLEIFYKRNWMNKEQKKAITKLSTIRQQNLFFIYCAPRFSDLDEQLRNWRVRHWYRITKRSYGIVYKYDKQKLVGDAWHLKSHKMRRRKTLKGIIKGWGPMPPDVDKPYRKLKATAFRKKQEKDENKGKSIDQLVNEKLYAKVKEKLCYPGMTINKACNDVGLSRTTYYNIEKRLLITQ